MFDDTVRTLPSPSPTRMPPDPIWLASRKSQVAATPAHVGFTWNLVAAPVRYPVLDVPFFQ